MYDFQTLSKDEIKFLKIASFLNSINENSFYNWKYFKDSFNMNITPILRSLSEKYNLEIKEYEIVNHKSREIDLKKLLKEFNKSINDKKDLKKRIINNAKTISELNNVKISKISKPLHFKNSMNNYFNLLNEHKKKICENPILISQKIEQARSDDFAPDAIIYSINDSYYISNDSYRVYSLIQQIPSDIRALIFPISEGYLEIDLKAAHFSIFCMLVGIGEIDLREKIIKETSLDKKIIKNAINKLMYGQGIKAQIEEIGEENYNLLNQNSNYKLIIEKLEWLKETVMDNKYFWELNFKKIPPKQIKKGSPVAYRLHYLFTFFERLLISSLGEYILKEKEITIVLDQHDGLTLHFNNLFNIQNHFAELKKIIENNKYGIKTSLEIK
jgi:hypothetical protein